MVADLRRAGTPAEVATSGEILSRVVDEARSGDTILVMSNGGFEGLVSKLEEAIAGRGGGSP